MDGTIRLVNRFVRIKCVFFLLFFVRIDNVEKNESEMQKEKSSMMCRLLHIWYDKVAP